MAFEPLRVGCIGMGWWSDVLADAMQRSGKFAIVTCYTRSEDKRAKFEALHGDFLPQKFSEAVFAE
jgi:predicted dehydrogenase